MKRITDLYKMEVTHKKKDNTMHTPYVGKIPQFHATKTSETKKPHEVRCHKQYLAEQVNKILKKILLSD